MRCIMFDFIRKWFAKRKLNRLTREQLMSDWNKLKVLDAHGSMFNTKNFNASLPAVKPFMEIYRTFGEAFMYRFIEDVGNSHFQDEFIAALTKFVNTDVAFHELQQALNQGMWERANLLAINVSTLFGLYLKEEDHLWYSRIRFAIRIRSLRFDKSVPERSLWEVACE